MEAQKRVEAAEAHTIVALRQQDAELRSNNTATHAKATKSDKLQAQLIKLTSKREAIRAALETERDKRKLAEARVLIEQQAAVDAAREHDREVRSSNQRTMDALGEAQRHAEKLLGQLKRARQLKSVIEASSLEAELAVAHGKLNTLNKANATLRQRVASSGITEAEAQLRAFKVSTAELETKLAHLERHLR